MGIRSASMRPILYGTVTAELATAVATSVESALQIEA